MAHPSTQPRPVGPGLPPVCGQQARVLILGSFPSPKSRAQGFYYGHPQNRFWPLLASLLGAPVPDWQDLDAKRALVIDHGLAVWDVVCRCTITGASDAGTWCQTPCRSGPPGWGCRPSSATAARRQSSITGIWRLPSAVPR